jgi:esterase/lipase superfamily enzyme
MSPLRVGLVAAVTLVALGCQAKLMPTPLVCLRGRIDPYSGFPEGVTPNVVELFYATDRNPVDDDDPEDRYGNQRGYLLRLGRATVRMGDADEDWRECRDETLDGERQPERLTEVHEFGPLWTTVPGLERQAAGTDTGRQEQPELPAHEFAEAIDRRLAVAPVREVTVFVPGINTGFGRPLLLAAGLAHFMGTDGVVVAYSWPVSGNMLAYARDTETVRLASRNLRELLRLLADRTDVERINLLGYSRGAAVVNGALLQLRLMNWDCDEETLRSRTRIGTVVYAGPDEDVDLFRSLVLDRVGEMVEAYVVYLSTQDLALSISRSLMSGTRRLGVPGEASDQEAERLRAETVSGFVDVGLAQDRAGRGLWGHSFWVDNPWVSSDLILTLRYALAPRERGLVREGDELFWSFPEDYPERVAEVVDGLDPVP